MAKGKHSEAEIIGALKQLEAGRRAEEVADLSLDKDMLKAVISKNGWGS